MSRGDGVDEYTVSAFVWTTDQQHAAKAAEVLARAAAGLVLDGVNVSLRMAVNDDDGDDG